jgi:hypothetical protein
VDSDRFDDVEFRIIEAPSPEPRRSRRRGFVALGAVLLTCGLGLGGSALADSKSPATSPSLHDASFPHHGGCHHGGARSRDAAPSSTLRY